MNLIEQLEKHSKIVADSVGFQSVKQFKSFGSPTIYTAAQEKYAPRIDKAIGICKLLISL